MSTGNQNPRSSGRGEVKTRIAIAWATYRIYRQAIPAVSITY